MFQLTPEAHRSLALHRAVAEQWRKHPEWRGVSIARIDRWEAQGALHAVYAGRWRSLLAFPDEEFLARIIALDEEANDMRQTSPVTCNLQPRERWRILKALRSGGDE